MKISKIIRGHRIPVMILEPMKSQAMIKIRPVIDSFSADSNEGFTPFQIIFTCIAHDPDGEIVSYSIDYGDGSNIDTNITGWYLHILIIQVVYVMLFAR